MEKSLLLKRLAISFVFSFCIAGFIWICKGQLENFFHKRTVVNSNFISDDSPFPNILFCATEAYLPNNYYDLNSNMTKETYDQYVIPVNAKFLGQIFFQMLNQSSGGSGTPETHVSGFGSAMEKWVQGKLIKAFLHFLPNFNHI